MAREKGQRVDRNLRKKKKQGSGKPPSPQSPTLPVDDQFPAEPTGWEYLEHENMHVGNDADLEHGEEEGVKTKKTKHQKKSIKRQKEEEIREIERKRRAGLIAPKNTAEFEQMVLSSPNSSYVWIQYMAYVISQGEVAKARTIAQRAIGTIAFREQREKFNIWIAWINIENIYGTEETIQDVFQKAMSQSSPHNVLKTVLNIYEQTGKIEQAQRVASMLCKLSSDIPESWIRTMQFWLRQGDDGHAHETFRKSLQALPKRHHVHMSSQAALLEFKIGDPEKGRSIMEQLLQDNPKRTDLWSVYLDQEVSHGTQQRARALFERCIHLTLPPKKMKFMFKKYLEYEKKYGDDDSVEEVKKKAMEYVEKTMAQ